MQSEIDELMGRYLDGDETAFDALYRAMAPDLGRYLRRRTHDADRAEELLQITFAKVHNGRRQYDRDRSAAGWITSIAKNALRDDWRRRSVRREDLTATGVVPEAPDPRPRDPFDGALVVKEALEQLPPKLREAIELTTLTGFTTAEAAEALGTSRSNVKVRTHRGYEKLRRSLGD